MIKNFLTKRGDQLAFTITFTSATPVSAMEFGVKERYSDDFYKIIKTLDKKSRNVVFIGDSYAEGYTPDGYVKGWPEVVKENLELNYTTIKYRGGTGFHKGLANGTFTDLLNQVPSSNSVTDVVVAGGYNDRFATAEQNLSGIKEFCDTAKLKFPNATIYIGMIGWTTVENQQQMLRDTISVYKAGASSNGAIYMSEAEDSIHNSKYFSSDNIHPNQEGENEIAKNVGYYLPDIYSGGITKVSDFKYQIVIPSSEMSKLEVKSYVYDLRMKIGDAVKTPLSGKLMIKETVFED